MEERVAETHCVVGSIPAWLALYGIYSLHTFYFLNFFANDSSDYSGYGYDSYGTDDFGNGRDFRLGC